MLVRDGLSSYHGCLGNPVWSRLGEINWVADFSGHGFGSPTAGSEFDASSTFNNTSSDTPEIISAAVKEGDDLELQCHAWKKCYRGYERKKHYFYHIGSVRVCKPHNCYDFPTGSKIIDYSPHKFGVRIKKVRREYSGLWACRIEDSGTGEWSTLRNFNVTVNVTNEELEN